MGKSWVWIVILVVVVVVVVVLAGTAKKKKAAIGNATEISDLQKTRLISLKYEAIATSMSQSDDYGRRQIRGENRDLPLAGTGWVSSVEATEAGGQRVMITVKAPGTGGGGRPEVIADVPKDKMKQGVQLGAGQKVDYSGIITDVTYEEGTTVISIAGAEITPLKK